MSDFKYVGTELDLFAGVHNWKSYWSSQVRPFLAGDILEVGAGIGSNTQLLDPGGTGRWVCLEPDRQLASRLKQQIEAGTSRRTYESVCGTLASMVGQQFDTIIYIDVLEHIEDDRGEMARAAARLKSGGALIVLAPAHPFLFTPFDRAIGHFRRYTRASLHATAPETLRTEKLIYLDATGVFASIANRLALRRSLPKLWQILVWDRLGVPVSRLIDPLLGRRVGKTVLGVWRKAE